ncbi:MAG: Mini-ribonuclease 3 [Christensenellaceae bacterium]
METPILSKQQTKNINSITLAFIGDAVFSLHVRLKLALNGDKKSGELNEETSKIVCAVNQARLMEKLLPELTDEEKEVYKRARNAKKPTHAKHSTVSQYNKSTGFEALIGYLYLTGDKERLDYVLNFGEEL